jgi:hypothetical protein
MNFEQLYKKIYELDNPVVEEPNEGNYFGQQVQLAKMRGDKKADLDGDGNLEPVKEMGCGVGPEPTGQQDNVSMNVNMSGSGSGGIRDLINILKNIEGEHGGGGDDLGDLIGKMDHPHDDEHGDTGGEKAVVIGDDQPVDEFANEPAPSNLPLPMAGDDLHKPHGNYPATQPGDNPMAVARIRETLENLYKKYQ